MIKEVTRVIEENGKAHVRLIPFGNVWQTFWGLIKEHFFLFEQSKVGVVYFHNIETGDFIGPIYDAGIRFKKDECKKRYSVFGKEAVVVEGGIEVQHFVK